MLRCVFPFNGFGEECKLSVSHNIVEGKPSALYLDPGSCGVVGRAVSPEEWGDSPSVLLRPFSFGKRGEG